MGRRNYSEIGVGEKAVPFDSMPACVKRLCDELGARERIYSYGTPNALFMWQEAEQRRYEARRRRRLEREKERQKRLKEERKQAQQKRRNYWKEKRVGSDS
jgi:hypothetical protein